jgi:GT2 family glycosyltransferase
MIVWETESTQRGDCTKHVGALGAKRLPPLVHIVLLNWNGWRDTSECLRSLRRLDYAPFVTLVVDNGSSDDSVMRLREAYPEIEITESGANLGFAGGCNVGIRRALTAGADYIWLLNNDTTVETHALRALVNRAEQDPGIGAVGSAIYSMTNPKQLQAWGGGYVNFWLGRSRHFEHPVSDSKIEFLTGASMLLRHQAVDAVGLLDDGFFMYWEDGDYCFRLRGAGWKLAVAGESEIRHKESSSVGWASPRMDSYFSASAARFFRKHARLPSLSLWTGVTLSLAKRALMGDWQRVRALWGAVAHLENVRR